MRGICPHSGQRTLTPVPKLYQDDSRRVRRYPPPATTASDARMIARFSAEEPPAPVLGRPGVPEALVVLVAGLLVELVEDVMPVDELPDVVLYPDPDVDVFAGDVTAEFDVLL